jgi:HPt (histidine-containing phosphotransfer) domain-containing protein
MRALARNISVTPAFISDLEKNRRSTDRLSALSQALEVPVEELQRLDPRLPVDLKEWLHANPALVAVLREMQVSAARYDAVTMESLAHGLRGCASSVGASRLAELCGELEEHARTGAVQTASRLLIPVEDEFTKVASALELEKAI